ncbi:hypothetical protein HN865_02585, partial [Candidatus Woesearchaeota archaeon]|nr:hypothetical protein [Candidatus Woesearchaeota archaeon]
FMKEKKIKIINNVKNLPIIQVDPDRFSQILQNLINNAIKFSSENGKIEVNAIKKNNILEFSVSDKGIGLNPGDAAKIFEPFFQAEQSIYREQGGSGLGLAICRGIVLAQGGGMWVESKKGKGSTFYFTIPLKPVKEIKPIRLLFSKQENVEEKLKELFKNILGPIGDKEFELLKSENELVEDKLSAYVNLLVKKGILEEEKGNNFKDEIYLVIGTRLTKTRNTYSGF